jgi:FixJ family two-component response regulator
MSAEMPTVFVVDDDRSVRDSLRRLITSLGMAVEVFPTAQAFLSASRGDAPACLILDVRLPGLSGLDLQRELTNANATLPIIFLTGHGDIPMSVRAMKAGAIEFLTKPFREQDLLDAIRQAIERDRAAKVEREELSELRGRYDTLTPRERDVMAGHAEDAGTISGRAGSECRTPRGSSLPQWRNPTKVGWPLSTRSASLEVWTNPRHR